MLSHSSIFGRYHPLHGGIFSYFLCLRLYKQNNYIIRTTEATQTETHHYSTSFTPLDKRRSFTKHVALLVPHLLDQEKMAVTRPDARKYVDVWVGTSLGILKGIVRIFLLK